MINTKNSQGFLLVSLMITVSFIAVAALVTMQLALNNLYIATVDQHRINAQFAADAGADQAIQALNTDAPDFDWNGTGGEQTLFEDANIKTTYETTVTDHATDQYIKYLHVTGRTYAPKTSATPRVERKIVVETRAVVNTTGESSVVAGVGGLTMGNSAKILGGEVNVNGTIILTGNNTSIGTSTKPVNVNVAHQSCPTAGGATYPVVCTSGEPITLGNNTHIYGDVVATNQTSGSRMSHDGLQPGTVPPIAMPSHDREGLKSQILASGNTLSSSAASCNTINGTKTWQANTKINGDAETVLNCKITVRGDIWITGSFDLANSAQLIAHSSLTEPPTIMIDGSDGLIMQNNSKLIANSSGVGFKFITYWSDSSCSPDCTNVTGHDLYKSQNHRTIQLRNSSGGAYSSFYARWSKVSLENSATAGALAGQKIEFGNGASVTFGSSVVGGGTSIDAWVVKNYKRAY